MTRNALSAMARLCAGGACTLLLGVPAPAFAGPGEPEAVPVTATTAITVEDDAAQALAVQPDGRIVVVGKASDGSASDIALVRYRADGSLDASFGGDGIVTTGFGAGNDEGTAVALQPDGKIVVAGFAYVGTDYVFALLRYTPEGELDASFGGGDGIVTKATGGHYDFGSAVAIQPDGKILLAGSAMNPTSFNSEVTLLRFTAEGEPDGSFGNSGVVTTAMAPSWSGSGEAIGLQPDGKILVAGQMQLSGMAPESDLLLIRYLPDGSLDPDFGPAGGIVTAGVEILTSGYDIALQPDGKILVAGETNTYDPVLPGIPTGGTLLVARFLANGALDASFDGDGIASIAEGARAAGRALALQPDGKIVVGGTADNSLYVVRLDATGALDLGFGHATGKMTFTLGDKAGAMAVSPQPNGTLLVAGHVTSGGADDFHWMRLLANDADDDLTAEAWDLTPGALPFATAADMPAGTEVVSGEVTISGLQEGVAVLARVGACSHTCGIALNDAADYRSHVWVRNGDRIRVRHTAADSASTDTAVAVGGISMPNSPAVPFEAADVVVATFTSTLPGSTGDAGGNDTGDAGDTGGDDTGDAGTGGSGSESTSGGGGGGSLTWWSLLTGLLFAVRRRSRE